MAQDEPQYEMHALDDSTDQRTDPNKNGTQESTTRPLSRSSSITVRDQATTSIHNTVWALAIVMAYAGIALFAWIALCIMNKRPMLGLKEKSYYAGRDVSYDAARTYRMNERNYIAAQVLQSVAALLTIPITSAVCSMACVAYMQAGSLRKNLTLRQTMALADRGWISPSILIRIDALGSLPLYVALALTFIGSIAQILQSAIVNQESILASNYRIRGAYIGVVDVPDLVGAETGDSYSYNNDIVPRLRELMESPYRSSSDANSWKQLEASYSDRISYGASEASSLVYVPLGSDFNTGAFPDPQYAPRINSSISYVNITESEFKKYCRNETDNGEFYAKYELATKYQKPVMLEACMPVNLRKSPWNATRDRQDITEELYLGTIDPEGYGDNTITYWRASAKTSLGYFELPSELNGNKPGALLDKDPMERNSGQLPRYYHKRAENVSYHGSDWNSRPMTRGPLASVALALFGRFSFVESRMADPSRFVLTPTGVDDKWGYKIGDTVCAYRFPLSNWIGDGLCILHHESLDEPSVYYQVRRFSGFFGQKRGYQDDVVAGLQNALFMANKLWLSDTEDRGYSSSAMNVSYDKGIRITKPKISLAGVIVGSIFLGAHLLGLFTLAMYVLVMKPWAGTMGAEVMLKMGMVYSDILSTLETEQQWEGTVGQLPGFIGDAKPSEEVGQLRMGALAGLSRRDGRKFEILK